MPRSLHVNRASRRAGATAGCLLAAGLVLLGGCAGKEPRNTFGAAARGSPASEAAVEAKAIGGEVTLAGAKVPTPPVRRIIYTAEVDLVVERLTEAEAALKSLVKVQQGFVASNDVGGSPGSPRAGTWTVRIPVDRFETFMAEVPKLGELQRVHTDSQDVGEEYYDLEARLSSKRLEEERLLSHLKRSTARLQDILAVERELSRVRGEIEQLQGRLRYLSNRTELTTVTIRLNEVKEYLPPERTTFTAQIGRSFNDSLGLLGKTAAAFLLLLVALAPWALVLAVVAVPVWLVLRRRSFSSPPKTAAE